MVQAMGTGTASGQGGADMRAVLTCAVLWFSLCLPARAAELEVSATGSGAALADVVISLYAGQGSPTPPATRAVMDQRGSQFVPHVLPVQAGTSVVFPNSDQIRHQVYSFSASKRFELPLYAATSASPIRFDQAGVVVLGCNIHDWMVGYIYVTDDPWFAVSDEAGKLHIDDLPVGRYHVTLWHPQITDLSPQTSADIEVPAAGLQLSLPIVLGNAAVAPIPPAPVSSFGEAFKKATDEDR